MRRLAALAILLLAGAAEAAPLPTAAEPSVVAPPGSTPLAAHRALYQLTLDSARGDVVAASGTMRYEVLDACDGWAVQQRLDMTISNRDGQDIQMISDYTTWEAKNGAKLRFRMRQTTDTAVTLQTEGEASIDRPGGPGEVHYTAPQEGTKQLPPGTLFPMAHTEHILQAAAEGKKFLALPLFDGTTDTGADDTFVVITSWNKPEPYRFPDLSNLPSGRVHVSFFEHDAKHQVPDYQVGQRYWSNGVADDLQMDFGDFVMDGKLSEFRLQPHAC
ncbi:MAG: cell envelope integrity EipB family protein [Acidisphaera sp.]|nr:cell envelope integrity EipB family protein [Acidisphaera sp.]